jgi:hypothetical protein
VSRQFDHDDEPEEPERPGPGLVRTTSPGALVVFAVIGLVAGWLLRPVSIRVNGTAPTVGWLPVLALLFAALVIGGVAWATYRTLHRRRERIEPHRAVNRLVLAKACALAGALVGGGYFGYAVSWLGLAESDLAEQRLIQSAVGGVAGVLVVTTSLLLERACRVHEDGDGDLR